MAMVQDVERGAKLNEDRLINTLLREISVSYQQEGYVLLRNLFPSEILDKLLYSYQELVRTHTGRDFDDFFGPEMIEYYRSHPEKESLIYNKIRESHVIEEISLFDPLASIIKHLLGKESGVFKKTPFRIDLPLNLSEFAPWHQDYFYVKGNTDIITAWIPFQDTSLFNGCLSVMPKSHLLGILLHTKQIGPKKMCPVGIYDREVNIVEMKKGDVLIFHSLLLHSSNINFSNIIRHSLQPRYTRLNAPVHTDMGQVTPI